MLLVFCVRYCVLFFLAFTERNVIEKLIRIIDIRIL